MRRACRALAGVATLGLAALIVLAGCGAGGSAPGATASPSPGAAWPTTPAPKSTRTTKPPSGGASRPARAAARIVFVDVGQGDAEAIRSGSWAGLIDGGPPGAESAVEAALRRLGVRRLDALVVSHEHLDHIGGLPSVVADYRPRRAYLAGAPAAALAGALRRAGTRVVQVRRGATLNCGAARATVLSPARLSHDPNQDSVVLLFQVAGRRFLFTGDCTGPNEAAVAGICARGPPLTVLKVAHHGSSYSTSAAFLAAARPRCAVISVGPNPYGHPSPATLARLRAAGARVYTTWKNGSITVTVTGGGGVRWSFGRSSKPVTRVAAAGGGAALSAPGSTIVYITRTGECYHRRDCRYLSRSCIPITLKEARARGYRPCSVCDPPR